MMNLSKNCSFLKMRKRIRFNSISGIFDTLTGTINIKDFNLDAHENDYDSMFSILTFCHEQMHYYQFISSSLGLYLSCLEDVEHEIMAFLINEFDFAPPLVNCLEKNANIYNEILNKKRQELGIELGENKCLIEDIILNISEIEILIWAMEGGYSKKEMELIINQKSINFSRNINTRIYPHLYNLYEHTGKNLNSIYENCFRDLKREIDVLCKSSLSFVLLENGETLGYKQILESHARYCEITRLISYIDRFHEEYLMTMKGILTKQDDYQIAYNIFKTIVVNMKGCDELFLIFVFCLICDYSINIPMPQTPQIAESFIALFDVNWIFPGWRFVHICKAVNKCFSKKDVTDMEITRFELKSLDDWNKIIDIIYEGISKETYFSSPLSIAHAFIDNDYKFDIEILQNYPFDYDNYLFLEACKTRVEYPLFFINPELFRLIDREKYIEISNRQGPSVIQIGEKQASLYNNHENLKSQGYLLKKIFSDYISTLFFGIELNSDFEKKIIGQINKAKEIICSRYGKFKHYDTGS